MKRDFFLLKTKDTFTKFVRVNKIMTNRFGMKKGYRLKMKSGTKTKMSLGDLENDFNIKRYKTLH